MPTRRRSGQSVRSGTTSLMSSCDLGSLGRLESKHSSCTLQPPAKSHSALTIWPKAEAWFLNKLMVTVSRGWTENHNFYVVLE